MIPDDEEFNSEDEAEDLDQDHDMKMLATHNNCESTAMVISPGKVVMTPNAQRIPSSPNKSVSFSSNDTLLVYVISHFIHCSCLGH